MPQKSKVEIEEKVKGIRMYKERGCSIKATCQLLHKLYLSAIPDLFDRRIVAYVLSERNDNALVFKTFDRVVKLNPDAHSLFHSNRGFQYTSRIFHQKIIQAGMVQSISRVVHCIDNGPNGKVSGAS